jgi:3-dehydroquinate dehydratase-2
MKFIVINGPSINLIGTREPEIYGRDTYADLEKLINETCAAESIDVDIFQSNHEGEIIDMIHQTKGKYDAIVINPAAYTHTSIAILDALKAVGLTTVEVHISDVNRREYFRQISYVGLASIKSISGQGIDGYRQAILFLKEYLFNF